MNDVTSVLTALADPTRRTLLEKLSQRGESTATALAEEMPISRQAVAQHLAHLSEAGLVLGQRRGREHHFIVHTEPLSEAARWMGSLAQQWDQRLRALKVIAERPVRALP